MSYCLFLGKCYDGKVSLSYTLVDTDEWFGNIYLLVSSSLISETGVSGTTFQTLTLKGPITIAADDIYKYFSLFFRENKT